MAPASDIDIDGVPLEEVTDVRLVESEAYRALAGIELLQIRLQKLNLRRNEIQGQILGEMFGISPADAENDTTDPA